MRRQDYWPCTLLMLLAVLVLVFTSAGSGACGQNSSPFFSDQKGASDQPVSSAKAQDKPTPKSPAAAPTPKKSPAVKQSPSKPPAAASTVASTPASTPASSTVVATEARTPAMPVTTSQPASRVDFFARSAFPPVMPDTEFHQNAWVRKDCLLCHRWGVHGAPAVRHEGMPKIVLAARCRTCHLIVRGSGVDAESDASFARNAFPPTLPDDKDHQNPWLQKDCLDCHNSGKNGAQIVRHDGMSKVLLTARCRTCHVLVRKSPPVHQPVNQPE